MIKLIKLASLCKCSVTIGINENRDYYETPLQNLRGKCQDETKNIDPDVLSEIIARDYLVCVQFYPVTPNGFYLVYHYDVEMALDAALEIMKTP